MRAHRLWITVCILAVISCILLAIGVLLPFIHKPAGTLSSLAVETKNIHYCNSTDRFQTLNFYRPKNAPDSPTPVIVYIHGGGWKSGSKDNAFIHAYGPLFIKEGLSIAAIDYRFTPRNVFPDQNNDVGCAISYLSKHSSEMKINMKKSLYIGESAGAELAAFAGLNPSYGAYPHDPPLGVMDFYGVSDFSKVIDGKHPDVNARQYLGVNYSQKAAVASPITYIHNGSPSFLIFHGSNDKVVPVSQSQYLYDKLIGVGVDAKLVVVKGARHGFTNYGLSADSYITIQSHLKQFVDDRLRVALDT